MKQIKREKSVFERLDHKNRNKSELVFYKLLARQKVKANPFGVAKYETFPAKEIKQGVDSSDTN